VRRGTGQAAKREGPGLGWDVVPPCLRDPGSRCLAALVALPLLLAPPAVAGGLALGAGVASALLAPSSASAQLHSLGRSVPGRTPRVFLDCQSGRNCDFDHFRTELIFVSWVRDRVDADVHLIFSTQGAGGGGIEYTMGFIGLGDMRGLNDELTYTSHGSDVQAEVLDGLTRTMRIGLLRFAVEAGQGRNFEIEFTGNGGGNGDILGDGAELDAQFHDPWDHWSFRVGLSGNMDLRETRTDSRLNPTFGADRVTADWKINTSVWANMRRDRRQLADGTEVSNDQNNWRVSALVVRSVSDHISVGVDAGGSNSVQNNQRGRVRMAPAVEYNYFPYAQATRRQFIAHYQVGVEYSDYYSETIFGVTDETVPVHQFAVQYRAREQWGNAGFGVQTSQYLHQGGLYNFGISGEMNYRVLRGLELQVAAGAAWVNDDIHTPAADIPDEDILLGRQTLPSSYRYQASVGFNFRFGSALANVVNTRFPGFVR
jgi:hypothetical protein